MSGRGLLLFLFASILAAPSVAIGQPPPPGPVSPGGALRADGDVPGAIAAFEKRYGEDPGDRKNLLELAGALSINRRLDDCFRYLALAVGDAPTVAPLIDPDLVTAREDPRWEVFEEALVARINAVPDPPIKDVAYARALWRLAAWDQAFFQEVGIAARKTGTKSSVVEAIWKLKFLVQKRSQAELDSLVARKGWPRAREVGKEAAMGAYLVAMHSSDGAQKRYLPAIRAVCEAGELPWARYANMYDRSLFNDNLPQRFGTHTRFNERTKSEELYPLEDESRVDEWRKEVGLPPLRDALAPLGIVFEPRSR
ncbi:MAG TPA: hypothetical protein PKA62_11980 [Thermoanaerobaculia bacterium]|nr:hypothetical protein [Thermoanaerobaculia bacterium]